MSAVGNRNALLSQFSPLLGWRVWALPLVLSIVLITISRGNYLLFHSLAEFFAIVVGVLMYVVALQTYRYSREHFLMYLASGYLWIACLDLVHTLIYKGMGVYPIEIANPSTQFWIAARYCEALLLLSAPFFFTRAVNPGRYVALFCGVAATLYLLIMSGNFPDCFIEGEGLTPFKVVSEYIIVTLLFMTLLHIYFKRHYLSHTVFPFLIAAIVLTICAELAFTFYVSVYGLSNLVGHIFKLFSFWLIFYSIVGTSLRNPYEALEQHKAQLENTVKERTQELTQARDKVASVNKQLISAQELTHVGNWEWDIVSGTLHWSDEVYRIFGLQPQQFDANYEAFIQYIHPNDRSRVEEAVKRALKDGDFQYLVEHRVIRPDQSQRIVQEKGQVYRDKEGMPYHMSGTVLDITEQKQVEQALVQTRDEAEAANKIKSRFLSSMSHELRTPLNAILGFSEMMMRNSNTTAEHSRMLNSISRSGEHLLRMINDVLDLSKIESGQVEMEPEAIDLKRVLADIVDMIRVHIDGRDIQLIVEISEDMARYVKVDMGKLRQILIQLLDNAVKFTIEGGVSLRARTVLNADDPNVVTLQFEIQDSGPGIHEKDLQKIFKPFMQIATSKKVPRGTGLGLAVTQSFVELMGGQIVVESTPGQGTLFCVDLPVALAEASDVAVVNAPGQEVIGLEPGQSEWRILVVEDDEANRELLSNLLRQVGLDVRDVDNGEKAIEMFEQWHPHLIWMDMCMPLLDGYQTTHRIRELAGGDEVKIVVLTASIFKGQRKQIVDAGCDTLVHKPFKSHEIFDTLEQQLGVRFIRAETVTEKEALTEEKKVVLDNLAEGVRDLTTEQTQALKEAAGNLDIVATEQVITHIHAEQPELADGLRQLAEKFQFGEILALLDKQE